MKKYNIYEPDMKKYQIFCVLILLIGIYGTDIICPGIKYDSLPIIIFIMPYFFLHEIVHSIAYVLFGADFKKITYGIHIERGILCCLCKQNISKKCVLISLISPFILLGVITYIIGVITNNNVLIMLSICNLSGCGSDLILFYDFFKLKNFEYTECDNPMNIALYTEEDLSSKKIFGLKLLSSENSLERKNYKKFNISKLSKIFLIAYIVIVLIFIFYSLLK